MIHYSSKKKKLHYYSINFFNRRVIIYYGVFLFLLLLNTGAYYNIIIDIRVGATTVALPAPRRAGTRMASGNYGGPKPI